MSTISNGVDTITPDLVTEYSTSQDARNVYHDILGRADDDVSLSADSLRSGSLALLFEDRAAAWAARALLAAPDVWTLTDPDVPEVGMTFTRDGALQVELDPETRALWLLSVGYQEVAP